MIRPFLLIAIIFHAAILSWAIDYSLPVFEIPGPELSVALVKNIAPSHTANSLSRRQVKSVSGPARQPRSNTFERNLNKPALDQQQHPTVASNPAEASHLRAVLHSAIQEHFVYPPIARKNGWQGRVYVGLTISNAGEFHDIRLVKRSPYPVLDSSAVRTLKRIGSVPIMQANLPGFGQDLVVPISFLLTEEI